jgi:hypothetical protein
LSEALTIAVERADSEDVRALLQTVSSWSVELYPPESRHGLDLAAIEHALRGRVATLRLETGVKQSAAIRLYEAAGFRCRGPFGSYRDDPLSTFMAKPL